MGNTCKPMAVSFQCMTKSTTKKKKKTECFQDIPGSPVTGTLPSQVEVGGSVGVGVGQIQSLIGELDPIGNN